MDAPKPVAEPLKPEPAPEVKDVVKSADDERLGGFRHLLLKAKQIGSKDHGPTAEDLAKIEIRVGEVMEDVKALKRKAEQDDDEADVKRIKTFENQMKTTAKQLQRITNDICSLDDGSQKLNDKVEELENDISGLNYQIQHYQGQHTKRNEAVAGFNMKVKAISEKYNLMCDNSRVQFKKADAAWRGIQNTCDEIREVQVTMSGEMKTASEELKTVKSQVVQHDDNCRSCMEALQRRISCLENERVQTNNHLKDIEAILSQILK